MIDARPSERYTMPMLKWAQKQTGFTIVELLIVVVVVAILAAITIVAYNGITNRAKAVASQSAISQVSQKLALYAASNGSLYPDDKTAFLAEAGVSETDSLVYDYYVSSNRADYCASASRPGETSEASSFVVTSKNSSAVAGRCVINYAKTPIASMGGPWTGYSSGGGASTTTIPNAYGNRTSYRWVAGAPGFSTSMNIGLEYTGTAIAVPANTQVYPSIMMRSSKAGNFHVNYTFYTSGVVHVLGGVGTSVAVPANTWTKLKTPGPVTVPATADRMHIRAQYSGGASWVSGDWIDVVNVSTSAGRYSYGDALVDGWFWTGAVNASPSAGPATIE